MNAGQVIELAREWVEAEGSRVAGFRGAHLMGGLNHIPKEASFPAYRDVDLNILLEGAPGWEVRDLPYKGLVLECGTVSPERYRSPDLVLSDPELASNLAVDSLLSDPEGTLAGLQAAVAKEYPRRKWVRARCEAERGQTLQALDRLCHASSSDDVVTGLWFFVNGLAGLIAVAALRPPTNRRCLILMKQVLEAWNRSDLQEETLAVFGCAHMDRMQVESYLEDAATAFDRAIEVTRTPIRNGGWKLHSYVRPYLIQGAQEMIDEGYHREAMFWIATTLALSIAAIELDGPESIKSQFQAKAYQILCDMGLDTPQNVERRFRRAQALADKIWPVADDIVGRNPELVD